MHDYNVVATFLEAQAVAEDQDDVKSDGAGERHDDRRRGQEDPDDGLGSEAQRRPLPVGVRFDSRRRRP